MASMLIRVSRDAARFAAAAAFRAARLAANAASSPEAAAAASRAARSASAAASRAARAVAAVEPRARHSGSCIRCPPRSGATRSAMYHGRAPHRCSFPSNPVPGLDVTPEDIASDEAMWALYEQWCKVYNKERDHDDMIRRFPIFKSSAYSVPGSDGQLGPRADGLEKDDNPGEFGDLFLTAWAGVYKRFGVPMEKYLEGYSKK